MSNETRDKFNNKEIIIDSEKSAKQTSKKLKFYNLGIIRIDSSNHSQSWTEVQKHKINSIPYSLLILIILIVFSGLITIIMWFTELYLFQILQFVTLAQGSLSFKMWQNSTIKPYISIFPFNYTNINDVLEFNHTPIVKELGPFVFREKLEKVNVVFNHNGTITYQEKRSSEFVPEMSQGDPEHLTITVPNILLISANKFFTIYPQIKSVILDLFQVKGFFDLKINDYFWGNEDIIYTLAREMTSTVNNDTHLSKFGIISSRRGVSSDRITIHSGVGNLNELGIITRFNGHETLNIWKTNECNRLDGSDGSRFPPITLNRKSKLYVYHPSLCRRLPLVYKEDIEIVPGVTAFRFQVPTNIFVKPTTNPDNDCYCTSEICSPSGIFNSSPCNGALPVMMSFPHFYLGDPELRKDILGLSPDPELHETFVDVHSKLGLSLGGRSRFQINVMLNQADGISHFRNFRQRIILPVAWIEVKVDKLPEDVKRTLQKVSIGISLGELLLKWTSLLTFTFSMLCLVWKIILKDSFMLSKKYVLT